jgi:hypothetical protein
MADAGSKGRQVGGEVLHQDPSEHQGVAAFPYVCALFIVSGVLACDFA